MKTILVPTDFSEQADNALETACHLGSKSNAQIVLLHVIEGITNNNFKIGEDLSFESNEEEAYMRKMVELAVEELEIRKKDTRFKDKNWRSELQVGNTYYGIKNYIVENEVDMVVMGTTGAQSIEENLLGSTTEKVIRYSKCPVLTVHERQKNFDYQDIVLATSLRKYDCDCLDLVKYVQSLFKGRIHLLRVNTPNGFERDMDVQRSMEKFAKGAGLENYTINIFNDLTEEEGIIYFSDQIDADLIVMPTHGRTGLSHLLTGSIAEDVASHAQRPVLTKVVK